MRPDIVQLKFSSGHEVVCEVMEWPSTREEDLIVRNAMTIQPGYKADGGEVYMFKPWVHYTEGPMDYVSINMLHIVATSRPTAPLMSEYQYAVGEMHSLAQERMNEEINAQNAGLAKLSKAITEMIDSYYAVDSDDPSDNIIKFPTKDTVH